MTDVYMQERHTWLDSYQETLPKESIWPINALILSAAYILIHVLVAVSNGRF
jgi:hypothetical protein